MTYQGKYLRVIEGSSCLPKGIIVWCFVDLDFEFRVKSFQDYCGVREFIFSKDSKKKFKIYQ